LNNFGSGIEEVVDASPLGEKEPLQNEGQGQAPQPEFSPTALLQQTEPPLDASTTLKTASMAAQKE